MSIEDIIFKRTTVDFSKLKNFGFVKNNDIYTFEKPFKNQEFKAIIEISKDGTLKGTVFDIENNEEYLPLRIEHLSGAFVGQIRKEYEQILIEIRENCFKNNLFINAQANRIEQALETEYGDKPEFPWDKFTGYGVFKNPDNDKWYALIMNINYSKIDDKKTGETEIVNIKLNPKEILELHKKDGFYPAWHMNKKSWITIVLDDTLDDKTILDLIKKSHQFTVEPKKDWIFPSNPKYFSIDDAFSKSDELIWQQTKSVKKGETVYLYEGAPISAITYKCEIIEKNIPYKYKDEHFEMDTVVKLKLLKRYDKDFMPFSKLKGHGVNAIRGIRTCPEEISKILK